MTRSAATTTWSIALTLASTALSVPVGASPWSVGAAMGARHAAEPEPTDLRPAAPVDDASLDARRREAAAAFADGEGAFERGDYATAARRFAHAHGLSPHQWTLYNLALSRARAGDPLGAWESFDALASGEAEGGARSEAERERDALRPLLALVVVHGPAGARICVDGVPLVVDDDGVGERVVAAGVYHIETATRDDQVALAAGAHVDVDASTKPVVRDRMRPWFVVATIGGVAAAGGATAAAVLADRPAAQGAAGAAAVAGAVTVAATIGAWVRNGRERRAAEPRVHCDG